MTDGTFETRIVPRSEAPTYYKTGWDFLGHVPYPDDPNDDYAFERWLEDRDKVVIVHIGDDE